MDIQTLARSMRARIPWEVAQKTFRANDVLPGKGWEKTIKKLTSKKAKLGQQIDPLTEALVEHFLCGEKLVRVHRVTKKAAGDAAAKLIETKPSKSAFRDAYPGLVEESDLEEHVTDKPQLVRVVETDGGVAAIYASVRSIETREEVDTETLPNSVAKALDAYDEILGIKLRRVQAMDVVWLPKDAGYIELRVDFPRGMHADVGKVALSNTREAFHKTIGSDVLTGAPLNLFPIIKDLYEAQDEGHVVELAFGTTTASLKHEKMRRRHLDLRKEIYHMAGKKALHGKIEPYRLSIEWAVEIADKVTAHPEVSFNGTARMAGAATPVMTEIIVRKCVGNADYNDVRSRLDNYIKKLD